MIEAKNIKVDGKLISLDYKSDLDESYQKLVFNVDTFEVIETSINENSQVRNYMLYSHLMKPLVEKLKDNKLSDSFEEIWY